MNKKILKALILPSVVILVPILVGLILWEQLPQQIPTHWNVAGEVDGWSSKAFAVFGMPLIFLGVQWLCALVTRADPKRNNHSDKILHLVFWIIPIVLVVLSAITYATALGRVVPVEVVMPVLLGLVFTIIGNYLPKCKQNYTIGIKIAWTLSSEENWNKTHRFAGRLWVVCGLVIILTGFFGVFWTFAVIGILMVLAPLIYSYSLYRKGV